MKRRVWVKSDGSLAVTQLIEAARRPGETDDEMFSRCRPRIEVLSGALFTGFVDVDEKELPQDGPDRHKWRVRVVNEKNEIFVDGSVQTVKTPEQVKWDQLKATASPIEVLIAKQIGLEPKSAADTGILSENS